MYIGYLLYILYIQVSILYEVTRHFLEMTMQHLQPGVLQGIELPVLGLVTSIVIGAADVRRWVWVLF